MSDLNNGRLKEVTDESKPSLLWCLTLTVWSNKKMHNAISKNQLADWSLTDHQDQQLEDYYECLVECIDEQNYCKRVCKEILMYPT